jgi:hypothetical protein
MIRPDDQNAVLEEIRLIVGEAIRDGDAVRAEGLAKVVAWTYPNSGLSASEIAERIRDAARAAGVVIDQGGSRPRLAIMTGFSTA